MQAQHSRLRSFAGISGLILVNLAAAVMIQFFWSDSGREAQAGLETVARTETEEERVIRAVEDTVPAVVSVLVRQKAVRPTSFHITPDGIEQEEGGEEWVETGEGTGFLVSSDGLIVTNRHVVQDRDFRHTVFLHDGAPYEANVLDVDPVNDLALLKINGEGLPTVPLKDDNGLRLGQTVIAIGNALGKFDNTVTRGILSGIGRSIEAADFSTGRVELLDDVLQTDAAINAGNSGGPLIDLDGRVIGVNTAVDRSAQGLGFAIPASEVREVLESYRMYGSIARPRLGIRFFTITRDLAEREGLARLEGAWVRSGEDGLPAVLPESPAAKAGLQEGDIILEVDGEAVRGEHSLSDVVQDKNVGDRVTLKIDRDGRVLTLRATLDAHPPVGF